MELIRREIQEIRKSDEDGYDFAGLLVKYGVKDAYDTVFKAGCFSQDLKSNNMRVMLDGHDNSKQIGVIECTDTDKGVRVRGKFNIERDDAKQAKQSLDFNADNGLRTGMSVGFWSEKGHYDENQDAYIFERGRIAEGSLTMFPAVPGSVVDKQSELIQREITDGRVAVEVTEVLKETIRILRGVTDGRR